MQNAQSWNNYWRSKASKLAYFMQSELFFRIIVVFFVLQALWFVVTAQYPMAFDESFHFGLIKLHATQWLPFFTHESPDAVGYGAPVRDPSYLYHFLMSIPYRIITLFTRQATAQIICLRLINVVLFSYSFVLFRRLLLRLGGSRGLSHLVLLIFSLLPITPFLAAHINYDNLFILVTVWTLLATCEWLDMLQKGQFSIYKTVILCSVMLLGCLVKYAFLPVMVALIGYMVWQLWRHHAVSRAFLSRSWLQFRAMSTIKITLLVIFFLISVFLFSERYVVNMVEYHQVNLDCGKVLSVQDCLHYGPWSRNYSALLHKPATFRPNIPWYIGDWLINMWERTFFATNYDFTYKKPLPIPLITAIVLGIVSTICFIGAARRIVQKQPLRQAALLAGLFFVLSLFLDNIHDYIHLGTAVAINGRYLLPFMPIILLFAGLALRDYWRHMLALKPYAALVVILLFLQGGGVITYIVQSKPIWDWQNRVIIDMNNTARNILQPVIVGSRAPK